MANYDPYRRHRRRESSRTLTAAQLLQIEEAFRELEQRAAHWEARAGQWEAAAAEAQTRAAQLETKARELQSLAANCQDQIAQVGTRAEQWAAAARKSQAQLANQEAAVAEAREKEEEWEQALQTAEEEQAAAEARLAQAQAEFQESRQRLERRFADLADEEIMEFARDLLPVLDNLERALEHEPAGESDSQSLRQGVEITRRAFLSVLERYGVRPLEAAGKQFDPNLHEAIGTVAVGALPPGSVAKVEQRGYSYKDKLLRPARVLITPMD